MLLFRLAVFAALLFAVSKSIAADGTVEPSQSWDGKLMDESLRRLEPQTGFIADSKTWEQVWKSWRPDDEVPPLDFSETLILVATAPGQNRVFFRPKMDAAGKVSFLALSTKIGGPGFGYALVAIPRADVTAINEHSLREPIPESITVNIIGVLRTGIVAIGGETTGTTISANGITWELDFGGDAALLEQASGLDGQLVRVRGRLKRQAGIEIRERWIVSVLQVSTAKATKAPTSP